MSGARVVADLRRARVHLEVRDGELGYVAVGGEIEVRDRLLVDSHRTEVLVALLLRGLGVSSAEEGTEPHCRAVEAFEERAAIIEFDGGFERRAAEVQAVESTTRSLTKALMR